MTLYWGVTPVAVPEGADVNQLLTHVCDWGVQDGRLERGDRIVLVAGIGLWSGRSQHGNGARSVNGLTVRTD